MPPSMTANEDADTVVDRRDESTLLCRSCLRSGQPAPFHR
jgi:hypothetical protein